MVLKRFVLFGVVLWALALAWLDLGIAGPIEIFWAPYGNGHKSAAEGMKKAIQLERPSANVLLTDISDFMLPGAREATLLLFDNITRYAPGAYHLGYKMTMGEAALRSDISKMSTSGLYDDRALAKHILKSKPSVILSSYSIGNEVLYRRA